MTNDFSIVELDKNIYVFKGLIPNSDRFVEVLKEAEQDPNSSYLYKDWQDWSIFGTYVVWIGKDQPEVSYTSPPDKYKEEKHFLDLIENAFKVSTETYLEKHGLSVGEDWVKMGPSISKYKYKEDGQGPANGLAMLHHTDYKKLEREEPGNKFALTCTMYLNDDYEGGGLSFLVKGSKDYIDYKPEAGDVIVFPAGHPDLLTEDGEYYHGVKTIFKKDKYLIRCFYQIPFEGTPEWHANKAKYGEELWAKMERERLEMHLDKHPDVRKAEEQND